MKPPLIMILLFISTGVLAQQAKKTFFDEYWDKTKEENAVYYRLINKESDRSYLVNDYYMSDQLQMSGHYSDKKLFTENGLFVYYDEYGQKTSELNYLNGLKEGQSTTYFPTGEIKTQILYHADEYHGDYKQYYEDGTLLLNASFVNGKLRSNAFRYHSNGNTQVEMIIDVKGSGTVKAYYLNGHIREEGQFKEGLQQGDWKQYNQEGEVTHNKFFNDWEARQTRIKDLAKYSETKNKDKFLDDDYESIVDILLESLDFSEDIGQDVTEFPDVEAVYQGGALAMQKFIADNVEYPQKAVIKNIQEKIYVSFIVDENGSIDHVKCELGRNKLLIKEAIRLVKMMPNWIPGELKGKKVATRCRLPINFVLN